MREVLRGWAIQEGTGANAPVLFSISRSQREFVVERHRNHAAFHEPTSVSAVCTLVVEIVAALVSERPALGSLHAAAAEIGDRLVLFPATHHAGKSTLMARLAAQGCRIFADDLILVDLDRREAVSTGCLPRLRLPVPAASSSDFRAFVAANTIGDDGYYAYLDTLAPVHHGDRAPVGAVVLLDRRPASGETRLEPIAIENALLALLRGNTNGALPAADALARYLAIVEGLPAWRLCFDDLECAVACLATSDLGATVRPMPAIALDECREGAIEPALLSGEAVRYARDPAVTLKIVGEAGFLHHRPTDTLHALNRLGLGLWNLLAAPLDAENIVSIFLGAFPDAEPASVRGDVDALLATLLAKGLVVKTAPQAAADPISPATAS